jgi:hypothetical protein
MSSVRFVVDILMPALASFGPVFLVAEARRPGLAKPLRGMGVAMVSGALMLLWFVTTSQRHEISSLQQRVEFLEGRGR